MLGQAMPQPPMSRWDQIRFRQNIFIEFHFSIGLADLQENGLNNLMLADEMESESDNDDTVLSDDTKEQKAIPKTPVKVELQVILLQDYHDSRMTDVFRKRPSDFRSATARNYQKKCRAVHRVTPTKDLLIEFPPRNLFPDLDLKQNPSPWKSKLNPKKLQHVTLERRPPVSLKVLTKLRRCPKSEKRRRIGQKVNQRRRSLWSDLGVRQMKEWGITI